MKTLFFLIAIHMLSAGQTNPAHNHKDASHSINHAFVKQYADTTTLAGQWYLQPVLPSDTATGKTPFLHINLSAGSFNGNTGCNNMEGSFKKTDTSLVFNQNISTTKMLCTGYNEAAFIKSLLRTNKYKFDKGELVLLFDATELSRWARKKALKKVLSM